MLPAYPTLAWPFFSSAVSSSTTIAPGSPSRAKMNRCSAASAAAQSQACSARSACIRRGVACPPVSASCQHDLRSPGSASSAPIYPNAVSRDLACANTPASSPNSSRLAHVLGQQVSDQRERCLPLILGEIVPGPGSHQ
jgi:hypothetical protein